MRDIAPKIDRQPAVHTFTVRARNRAGAIVAARDRAWRQGLWVVGDAQVRLTRSRVDGHQFVVGLPCLDQE